MQLVLPFLLACNMEFPFLEEPLDHVSKVIFHPLRQVMLIQLKEQEREFLGELQRDKILPGRISILEFSEI